MIEVTCSRGTYPVRFLRVLEALDLHDEGALVVTDDNLYRHYQKPLERFQPLVVEPGESSKSLDRTGQVLSWMAQRGATRRSVVVAVGGGVIGDLAGFAAAVYARGVPLVMVPTSLLAMVDSSVGGKVGVDLPEGKNLVGAFWPPQRVDVSTEFLKTLPDREFVCGAAEVWKYAFIGNTELLAILEKSPLRLDERVDDVVMRCVRQKADVVENDEFETTGRRATLNFGHTIGHALESVTRYQTFTHGEAISIGMTLETRYAERAGICPVGTTERVQSGLAAQGLPTELPEGVTVADLVPDMRRDKKAVGTGLSMSLLTKVGECKLVTGIAEAEFCSALMSQ